jgi:Na+-translocating ferredoxin:NAD+ oxidoreductase subunit G
VRRQLGKIIKPAAVLFIICTIVAFALAFTNSVTREIIEERIAESEKNSRRSVLPDAESFNKIENIDDMITDEPHLKTINAVYEGVRNGNRTGYVFDVKEKGYGGDMNLMVGIDSKGVITGVEIGNNNETPGLGSKASDEDFKSQFTGIAPKNKFRVVKEDKSEPEEIEAITGATITSRAVTRGVQAAYDMWVELGERKGIK